MKREALRTLTNEYTQQQTVQNEQNRNDEKEQIFRDTDIAMEEAAKRGASEAVVYTVSELKHDLILIPSECGYSLLEDSDEKVERARKNLAALSPKHLRGTLAELRDHLTKEGLSLTLKMRIEGNSCRTARYVWDIVAHW